MLLQQPPQAYAIRLCSHPSSIQISGLDKEDDAIPRDAELIETIGKYRIEGLLGKGAMGTVYKAFDQDLERTVALKTVHRELISDMDKIKSVDRLKDEAQAGGRLNHPNIVTVFDYGENSSIAYIAMEFVEGTSLAALLAPNKPMALSSVSLWMTDLLDALDFIHERGIVHRDIKPSNLLITEDARLKVSDFGVAHIDALTSSHVGTRGGTPSYMSPEQLRGESLDGRTDIFSAGLVLYQLLTGARAFTGTTHEVMHQIFNAVPTPPSQLVPSLGGAFDYVVAKALAKSFSHRYGSAHEFLNAFRLTHSTSERANSPLFTADDNNTELSLQAGITYPIKKNLSGNCEQH